MADEDDRISALPDEIVHQILCFLPTKHSIQTSTLSKRWILLWKFTHSIDFPDDTTPSEFTFIHNTLTKHQALKLHNFRLHFSDGSTWYHELGLQLQRCIEFAISRQVQTLSVFADPVAAFADHYFGYKSEVEFIKHLLQKALVLETLSLTYHRLELSPEYYAYGGRSHSRPTELVQQEIFNMPRASSLVHILFRHTYHKFGT
ncbi:hypothetical protein HRI_000410800 [Hibiscus trionum]|uniref:F-box domain-containing protein n=1 Tax=Hibiscus trionum TaxID=183268 RepID=A0A9W7LL98_HIBTR|nr:hypothetical protein HRI_000410800 [Hibiscus trionum]